MTKTNSYSEHPVQYCCCGVLRTRTRPCTRWVFTVRAHTHTHRQTIQRGNKRDNAEGSEESNNCELSNWKKWKCIHPNDDKYTRTHTYTYTHSSIVCVGFETDSENFEVKCDHGFHMKRETSRQSEVRLIRFVIVVTNGCVVDVCVCVSKKKPGTYFFF